MRNVIMLVGRGLTFLSLWSHQWSTRPVVITILTGKLICFERFWKLGTYLLYGQHVWSVTVVTDGSAEWINKTWVINDPLDQNSTIPACTEFLINTNRRTTFAKIIFTLVRPCGSISNTARISKRILGCHVLLFSSCKLNKCKFN